MSKRFIDTEMFNDEWFSDLSKDCKLFFIYYITSCDHAGVLRLNKKLCSFQTGIKDLATVTELLSNCLVSVKDGVYFMPKFIEFQYPKFPNSKVKQQEGAINILKNLGFWDEKTNSYLTVKQELTKGYVSESVIVDSIKPKYYRQFKHLSLSQEDFETLRTSFTKTQIDNVLDSIENYAKNKNYTSLYLTALKWLKKEHPEKGESCPYSETQLRLAKSQMQSGGGLPEWFDKKYEELVKV